MQLNKIANLVGLLAALSSAANVDQALSGVSTLQDKVTEAKNNIKGYEGGLIGSLFIANSVYNAHKSATQLRTSLADSEPFEGEDATKFAGAVTGLDKEISSTIDAAHEKVGGASILYTVAPKSWKL